MPGARTRQAEPCLASAAAAVARNHLPAAGPPHHLQWQPDIQERHVVVAVHALTFTENKSCGLLVSALMPDLFPTYTGVEVNVKSFSRITNVKTEKMSLIQWVEFN